MLVLFERVKIILQTLVPLVKLIQLVLKLADREIVLADDLLLLVERGLGLLIDFLLPADGVEVFFVLKSDEVPFPLLTLGLKLRCAGPALFQLTVNVFDDLVHAQVLVPRGPKFILKPCKLRFDKVLFLCVRDLRLKGLLIQAPPTLIVIRLHACVAL